MCWKCGVLCGVIIAVILIVIWIMYTKSGGKFMQQFQKDPNSHHPSGPILLTYSQSGGYPGYMFVVDFYCNGYVTKFGKQVIDSGPLTPKAHNTVSWLLQNQSMWNGMCRNASMPLDCPAPVEGNDRMMYTLRSKSSFGDVSCLMDPMFGNKYLSPMLAEHVKCIANTVSLYQIMPPY